MILQALLVTTFAGVALARVECAPRNFGNVGDVCVCNATYCDTTHPLTQQPVGMYVMFTSNLAGERLNQRTGTFSRTTLLTDYATVDHSETFQAIKGFGGAFTDATGINVMSLPAGAREHFMKSYFSEEGIEYNLGRVPIGGTDFSTRAYSYLDTPTPDLELANFQLQDEDFLYKIPLIRQAMELTNNKLNLFASAWTAPKWMKTNEEYNGDGALKREFYQLWVDYFVRFLDEYKAEGIEFWGLTTGNEPSLAFFTWTNINSIGWLPWTQNIWIRNNLGPTIRNHSNYNDIKLIAHDDQRILIPLLFRLFDDEAAKQYIDGIGVHWYWDDFVPAQWLTQTHARYPDRFILATEACKGDRPWDEAVLLGSWQRGEAYAVDIIEDLQNWAVGWTDWNMALNMTGGPTYIDNTVDSPIIVDSETGEFYKQPMFYAMGHFSKYLPEGSVRISSPDTVNGVHMVAFDRPDDDGTVVVLVNTEENPVEITFFDEGKGYLTTELTPKSFNTIVYWSTAMPTEGYY